VAWIEKSVLSLLHFFFYGISRLAPPHPGHALVAISNQQPAGVLELAKLERRAEGAPEQVIGFLLLERDPPPPPNLRHRRAEGGGRRGGGSSGPRSQRNRQNRQRPVGAVGRRAAGGGGDPEAGRVAEMVGGWGTAGSCVRGPPSRWLQGSVVQAQEAPRFNSCRPGSIFCCLCETSILSSHVLIRLPSCSSLSFSPSLPPTASITGIRTYRTRAIAPCDSWGGWVKGG
jgi:hypothetical protein